MADFKQQLTLGIEHHQQGQLREAESIYKQLLEDSPKNCEVLHLLALLYGQNTNPTKAQRFINKALKIEPNNPNILVTSGNIAKQIGNYRVAEAHYRRAIDLDPKLATAYNNLGTLMAGQQDYVVAIVYYKQAIAIKPDYADALLNCGVAHFHCQEFEQASACLIKATESDQSRFDIWLQLGQLHQHLEELEQAKEAYQKCINIAPLLPEAYHQLGAVYAKQNCYDAAIDQFSSAHKLDPKNCENLHNLASLYFTLGQYQKALKFWLRMLSINPDEHTLYNIAVVYFYQGKFSEAEPYFLEVLKHKPRHIPTMINLAGLYIKRGETKQALTYYHQVLEIEPNNQQVQYVLSALEQTKTKHVRAPDDYVANLFDQYAPNFERHLMEQLAYRAPELICQALGRNLAKQSNLNILDLGCGTGLCGVKLKTLANRLVGIDLSRHMLGIAKDKQVYTELHTVEISHYLRNNIGFDLIVACDVLPYFGDLTELLQLVKNSLKNDGHFIFTVENTTEDTPYVLQKSARFKHNIKYLKKTIKKIGYILVERETVVTRTQDEQPVYSELMLLKHGD